jgi:hypothetical protein
MVQAKIKVNIPIDVAMRTGLAEYGETEYLLKGVLPLLSEETRNWLASGHPLVVNSIRVDVREALSDTSVAAAISAACVEQENKAKEEEEHRAALREWSTEEARKQDVAIEAARAAREAAAEREAVAAAEREAKKEQIRAEIRTWAMECDALPARIRRASSDGLEIKPELTKYLAECVATKVTEILDAAGYGGEITEICGNPSPREGVPSDQAYAILDALSARKQDIAESALIPGVDVEVRGFFVADIALRGEAVYRSVVDVIVRHRWARDLGCYVLTEPRDDDDEDE